MGTYPEVLDLDVLSFYHIEKAFEVILVEENVDRNTSDWGIYHFFKDVHVGENIHCDCYDLYRHKNENMRRIFGHSLSEQAVYDILLNQWHPRQLHKA